MRWLAICGGIVGAVVIALLAFGSSQRGAVDAALARSSEPLLVPQGNWANDFDFTAPPGATDLYLFRWNFRPGATDAVTGWQIAPTSAYDQGSSSEGPGQDEVDQVLQAARGDDCDFVDPTNEIQLCTYPEEFALAGVNAYLVRLVDDRILVVGYSNLGGDRLTYNPDSLEARFVLADFKSTALEIAIDDYLVYIY